MLPGPNTQPTPDAPACTSLTTTRRNRQGARDARTHHSAREHSFRGPRHWHCTAITHTTCAPAQKAARTSFFRRAGIGRDALQRRAIAYGNAEGRCPAHTLPGTTSWTRDTGLQSSLDVRIRSPADCKPPRGHRADDIVAPPAMVVVVRTAYTRQHARTHAAAAAAWRGTRDDVRLMAIACGLPLRSLRRMSIQRARHRRRYCQLRCLRHDHASRPLASTDNTDAHMGDAGGGSRQAARLHRHSTRPRRLEFGEKAFPKMTGAIHTNHFDLQPMCSRTILVRSYFPGIAFRNANCFHPLDVEKWPCHQLNAYAARQCDVACSAPYSMTSNLFLNFQLKPNFCFEYRQFPPKFYYARPMTPTTISHCGRPPVLSSKDSSITKQNGSKAISGSGQRLRLPRRKTKCNRSIPSGTGRAPAGSCGS